MPVPSLGTYYDQVKAGRVFIGSTAAAGTAFPVSTATAMTFGLWNTNPDKNAVLLRLNGGYTSGTIALGEIGLTVKNAGFQIGTGAPISAFTDGVLGTTIHSALIGSGLAPSMRFAPAAATIVAGVAAYWTGLSFGAVPGTPADGLALRFSHNFDGAVVLAPGQAAFVTGSIAQTGLFSLSLMWAEVDAD